ncbi:hypothetical protein ACKI2N_032635 [Cupriavidus sp. 30B13]|uniref:hypothetical protein n=1 Tax=Cupriavidus sp. 30B13 TaxID=3384241 RepID=UPI003B91EB3C
MTMILVDRDAREVWSDNRLSDSHMKVGAKKVHKTKRVMVGLAGNLSLLVPPRRLVNGDLDAGALLVKKDLEGVRPVSHRAAAAWWQSPHPVEVTYRYIAIGSGGMAAIAVKCQHHPTVDLEAIAPEASPPPYPPFRSEFLDILQ